MRSLKIHLRRLKARRITMGLIAAVPFGVIAPFFFMPLIAPLAVIMSLLGVVSSIAIYIAFEADAIKFRFTVLPSFEEAERGLVIKELKSKYAISSKLASRAAYAHYCTQLSVKEILDTVDPSVFIQSLNFIAETEAWFMNSLILLDQLEKSDAAKVQDPPTSAKASDLFNQIVFALKDVQAAANLIKETAREAELQEQEPHLPEVSSRPDFASVVSEVEALKSDHQKDRSFISLAQEEIKRKEMAR